MPVPAEEQISFDPIALAIHVRVDAIFFSVAGVGLVLVRTNS